MVLVRAHYEDQLVEVSYDPNDGGVDVLELQISSMFEDLCGELILLDFAGRRISSNEEMDDVEVACPTTPVLEAAGMGDAVMSSPVIDLWVLEKVVYTRLSLYIFKVLRRTLFEVTSVSF